MFAASQALRQHGTKFDSRGVSIVFDGAVLGALVLACVAAATWTVLESQTVLLRTAIGGTMCFSLTMAYLHAFPRLFSPWNLGLRGTMIFLWLFVPSLAIAWTVKIAILLIRRARNRFQGSPLNPRPG
jgi:hypothetical protein